MNKLIVLICFCVLGFVSQAQNEKPLFEDTMSYDEMMAIGKAYIDETYPDCDIDYFAPHCIYNKTFSSEDERQAMKKDWFDNYRYEYELCEYFYNIKASNQPTDKNTILEQQKKE